MFVQRSTDVLQGILNVHCYKNDEKVTKDSKRLIDFFNREINSTKTSIPDHKRNIIKLNEEVSQLKEKETQLGKEIPGLQEAKNRALSMKKSPAEIALTVARLFFTTILILSVVGIPFVGQMKSDYSKLSDELKQKENEIETLRSTIQSKNEEVKENEGKIMRLTEQLKKMNNQAEQLSSKLKELSKDINRELDNYEGSVNFLVDRIKTMPTSLSEQESWGEDIDSLATQRDKMKKTRTDLASFEQIIADLEKLKFEA